MYQWPRFHCTLCPQQTRRRANCEVNFTMMTPAGLEPAIPGSVGRCLIHWATGPDTKCMRHSHNHMRRMRSLSWRSTWQCCHCYRSRLVLDRFATATAAVWYLTVLPLLPQLFRYLTVLPLPPQLPRYLAVLPLLPQRLRYLTVLPLLPHLPWYLTVLPLLPQLPGTWQCCHCYRICPGTWQCCHCYRSCLVLDSFATATAAGRRGDEHRSRKLSNITEGGPTHSGNDKRGEGEHPSRNLWSTGANAAAVAVRSKCLSSTRGSLRKLFATIGGQYNAVEPESSP